MQNCKSINLYEVGPMKLNFEGANLDRRGNFKMQTYVKMIRGGIHFFPESQITEENSFSFGD